MQEAPSGFGPEHKGFADLRLTTWLWRLKKWSGRRGSDSRPPPWQGGALPTELLPHEIGGVFWCGRRDLNSYAFRHQILSLARLPFRHARLTLGPKGLVTHRGLEPRTP